MEFSLLQHVMLVIHISIFVLATSISPLLQSSTPKTWLREYSLEVGVILAELTPKCCRTPKTTTTDALDPKVTLEDAVEHAKRAFALKKFEQAVEYYASALELM